jgi:hypothetical protein
LFRDLSKIPIKKELPMKEKRRYERFSVQLPLKLELLTSSRTRHLDVETKDISASGAFIYTKEASYIPDDTRFLLNSSYAHRSNIQLKKWKRLENCVGTMVRSTSEGIAIRFNSPVELFV